MRTPPTRASRPATRSKGQLPASTTTVRRTADRPRDAVVLAVVAGAHGIAGEVRLKVFADEIARYRMLNAGAFTLVSARTGSNGTIARIAEVTDRNAAEALRGTDLWIPRSDLPPLGEDEYYHADLIGLSVSTETGEPIGWVVAVENFGAGDVIEVERESGRRFMVPLRTEAVPRWDADGLVLDAAFVE